MINKDNLTSPAKIAIPFHPIKANEAKDITSKANIAIFNY